MNGDSLPSVMLAATLEILVALIGAWDIYLGWQGRYDDTVSAILQKWSIAFPIFPLLIGIVLGHIFWPRTPLSHP